MTLVISDIPDNAADLPAWLERHVAGNQLAALVAELTAANGPGPAGASLAEVLGPDTDAVRTGGLARLSPDSLRALLSRPSLLLALQEWAILEGGPYWQRLFEVAPADPAVERGAARLEQFLTGDPVRPAADPAPRPRLAWYQQPWFVALATAACVLLAVYVVRMALPDGGNRHKPGEVAGITPGENKGTSPDVHGVLKPPQGQLATTWGWDRPDALKMDVTARMYLENLATAADEWSRKKPETAPDLARRLNEFRAGCSTLILTTHTPLNERDRIWLTDRCHEWALDIDKALTKLEEEGHVEAVREDADRLVARIVKSLRDRAARA
jgi:hypothetical protein